MSVERIAKIFRNVRSIVADKRSERWDDEDLYILLDKGQQDLARHTNFLVTHAGFDLIAGRPAYRLPAEIIQLRQVTFKQRVLKGVGATQMVKAYGPSWMTDLGPEPKSFVFDMLRPGSFRFYPIPTGELGFSDTEAFGVVDIIEQDVEWTEVDLFGTLDDLPNVIITYTRKPKEVSELAPELELSSVYDTALERFIAGGLLQNDISEANRVAAEVQLRLYERELNHLKDSVAASGVNAVHDIQLYNGIG